MDYNPMIINELNIVKNDIRTAIENKGYTADGGLTTYADIINSFELRSENLELPEGTKFAFSTAQYLPYFDTSGVKDFSKMFYCCRNLRDIEEYDTSSAENMTAMFYGCNSLKTIPLIDCGNVIDVTDMLPSHLKQGYSSIDIEGFRDLGKCNYVSGTDCFAVLNSNLIEAATNIINNLYDRAAAGLTTPQAIFFDINLLNKLPDEVKATATNKGWRVYGVYN